MSTTNEFQLSIGAKRQLTLPSELLDQLQVPDRGQLLIQVVGDHAVITPMISVPRTHLPEELRRTFESRRGAQPSDIPLAQFLDEIGYQPTKPEMLAAARPASPPKRPQELTPNEAAALQIDNARRIVRRARKPALHQPANAEPAAQAQRISSKSDLSGAARTNRARTRAAKKVSSR